MCGVIVVDAESFRSTWHGHDAYIHDHCLRYLHNYALFYQLLLSNLFTRHNTCYLERSQWWNLWPPDLFLIILHLFYLHRISFTILQSLFPIYTTKIPKIFTLLSSLDLTFASDREGIDNPFITLVARFLIVCAGTRYLRIFSSGLIPWFLTEGNTCLYFAASPFPLQGKNQRKLKK